MFLRLPLREKITTLSMTAAMVVAEVLVRRLPLPRIGRLLGITLEPTDGVRRPVRDVSLTAADARRLRCLARIARHWPLANGPCLRHALVAGWLLRSREPALVVGVARDAGRIAAHAWLELDGIRPLAAETFLPLDG